ncbi:MAG: DUF4258 domain-containing protein [Anaerolineae bacterium]|nr:DUF4258 domain-containing protein [Anaerolineae bacterium]MCB0226184.1 DUF4258 domain-containing protein [Anaerolineae bacterium]
MDLLQRIQRAVREQKYRVSSHANDEMADDFLMAADIESIIFTGKIARRFTKDPRGRRYAVLGSTTDNRRAYVVCRFLLSGVLLIITAYVAEEE